jgi:hypothetical protein
VVLFSFFCCGVVVGEVTEWPEVTSESIVLSSEKAVVPKKWLGKDPVWWEGSGVERLSRGDSLGYAVLQPGGKIATTKPLNPGSAYLWLEVEIAGKLGEEK